ncbi:invasion associated locus B family protein [Planktotalea arctica]|uniref:invasion associated locus B family protein n=1 Tax=Planktotalea arctica TaxID=1481893 RepID=UPI000A173B23|nr:invasion associated locus B family protein [Planktotalea arctica]
MVGLRQTITLAAFLAASALHSAVIAQEQASPWGTSCISLGRDTAPQCSMNHAVFIEQTGQVLFNVTVRIPIDAGQEPYLDIVAPLGFYLVGGLTMTVATAPFAKLPIVRCDANGCYAGVVLSKDQLNQLKQGETLSIMFAPKAGQSAQVDVPLKGFTTSFDVINH